MMARAKQNSTEYKTFKILQHWQPTTTMLPPKELANPAGKLFPLFVYLYDKTRKEYEHFPLRKNGQNPFIHPLNIVWQLQKAGVKDEITWCIGLIHDLVEEKVDIYKEKEKIATSRQGMEELDAYEEEVFRELEENLRIFCKKTGIDKEVIPQIMTVLHLLTRHKRDFYYRSISNIFNCRDPVAKERAIQVKLADRMHNILSVECFNEEERIYQCYKNLFILNNTKKFLVVKYGKGVLMNKKFSPTEKLFNKAGKATYDAFLTICHLEMKKGTVRINSMLQLAFKKFALLKGGLWVVTKINEKETHPLRLFQGIVRKYDARLYHEFDKYRQMKDRELQYCRNFFSDYKFAEEQLQAILNYKDAYALKELVAYLLYDPDFVTQGLLSSKLFRKM